MIDCFIKKNDPMNAFKKIMIVVDNSANNKKVMAYGTKIARAFKSEIILTSVTTEPVDSIGTIDLLRLKEQTRALFCEFASPIYNNFVHSIVLELNDSCALESCAEKENVDILIIGANLSYWIEDYMKCNTRRYIHNRIQTALMIVPM